MNFIEKAISTLSPEWAAKRAYFREVAKFNASYSGGLAGRTDSSWSTSYTNATTYGMTRTDRARRASMVYRARNLEENNALASAILDRETDWVIGSGMTVQARTEDEAWNTKAESLFAEKSKRLNLRGLTTFAEDQRMAFRSYERDGDTGCVLVDIGGQPKIQLIESPEIATPYEKVSDRNVVEGVQVDAYGRPTQFWVRSINQDSKEVVRPIGYQDFIFLSRLVRPRDVRGITAFAQTFPLFDQLDGYIDATVVASRMATMFGLLIHGGSTPKEFAGLASRTNAQGNQQKQFTMEPGMVRMLSGEKDSVSQVKPEHPTQSFSEFVRMLCRFLGNSFSLPLELVLLDFSQTNYSSARASMNQAIIAADVKQKMFADKFVSRIYQWVISKAIQTGELASRPDAWLHQVIPSRRPFLDPQKDIQADMMEIDAGFSTLTEKHMERGSDFDHYLIKRGAELNAMREVEIPIMRSTMTMPITEAGRADGSESQGQTNSGNDNDGN